MSRATFGRAVLGMPNYGSIVRFVNHVHQVLPELGAGPDLYPWGYRFSMGDEASTLAGQPVGRRVVMGVPRLDRARTRRLAELGLRAGAEVVVLHRTAGRGRIVAVGDTRIALDRATLQCLPLASASDEGLGR